MQDDNGDDWRFASAMFLTGSVFYLVQVSYTPLWSIFLATGWVACRRAQSFSTAVLPITPRSLAFDRLATSSEGVK
jgi:hypothetical protein